MYLMALRIDSCNFNKIYLDQNISIKFDGKGHGIKYDNRTIKIRNLIAPQDVLQVLVSTDGEVSVNMFPLIFNKEYVTDMIKRAKKAEAKLLLLLRLHQQKDLYNFLVILKIYQDPAQLHGNKFVNA